MGTLNKGLLGGFSGKVGNVVGSSCRGVEYIKSPPAKMTNPRTQGQTKQRSKFVVTQNFLRTITPFIRVGFKDFALEGMSAFNAAMSYNMLNGIETSSAGNVLNYPDILVSRGSLSFSNSINTKITKGELHFSWDTANKENAKPNDQVMLIAYNSKKEVSVYDINGGKRNAGATSLDLPPDWNGDIIETYIAFKSEDGSMVSNSCYSGSFTFS